MLNGKKGDTFNCNEGFSCITLLENFPPALVTILGKVSPIALDSWKFPSLAELRYC